MKASDRLLKRIEREINFFRNHLSSTADEFEELKESLSKEDEYDQRLRILSKVIPILKEKKKLQNIQISNHLTKIAKEQMNQLIEKESSNRYFSGVRLKGVINSKHMRDYCLIYKSIPKDVKNIIQSLLLNPEDRSLLAEYFLLDEETKRIGIALKEDKDENFVTIIFSKEEQTEDEKEDDEDDDDEGHHEESKKAKDRKGSEINKICDSKKSNKSYSSTDETGDNAKTGSNTHDADNFHQISKDKYSRGSNRSRSKEKKEPIKEEQKEEDSSSNVSNEKYKGRRKYSSKRSSNKSSDKENEDEKQKEEETKKEEEAKKENLDPKYRRFRRYATQIDKNEDVEKEMENDEESEDKNKYKRKRNKSQVLNEDEAEKIKEKVKNEGKPLYLKYRIDKESSEKEKVNKDHKSDEEDTSSDKTDTVKETPRKKRNEDIPKGNSVANNKIGKIPIPLRFKKCGSDKKINSKMMDKDKDSDNESEKNSKDTGSNKRLSNKYSTPKKKAEDKEISEKEKDDDEKESKVSLSQRKNNKIDEIPKVRRSKYFSSKKINKDDDDKKEDSLEIDKKLKEIEKERLERQERLEKRKKEREQREKERQEKEEKERKEKEEKERKEKEEKERKEREEKEKKEKEEKERKEKEARERRIQERKERYEKLRKEREEREKKEKEEKEKERKKYLRSDQKPKSSKDILPKDSSKTPMAENKIAPKKISFDDVSKKEENKPKNKKIILNFSAKKKENDSSSKDNKENNKIDPNEEKNPKEEKAKGKVQFGKPIIVKPSISERKKLQEEEDEAKRKMRERQELEQKKMSSTIEKYLIVGKIPLFEIDDYALVTKMGGGTFGKIFLVVNIETKEKFAMKKIVAQSLDEAKEYYNECQIIHNNVHPHIINVYAANIKLLDITTCVVYFLLELAEKDWDAEINERLKKNKYYTEEELLLILKQVVSALVFLETKKVSHRDIKPQNILITKSGTYKLADFGEAKKIRRTAINTLRGTDLFMSPLLYSAVLNDEEEIKHNSYKSDVYSLGLCFVFAGFLRFKIIHDLRKCRNDEDIKIKVTNAIGKRYSEDFLKLVLKMLTYEEDDRPNFHELQKYIEQNFPDSKEDSHKKK